MDYLDKYYAGISDERSAGYDRDEALRKGIGKVLPLMLENELTTRQEMCLRYKYVYGKTQNEIGELLKLSQPTVSRYIARAKEKINGKLRYCWAAASSALDEYDK